MSTKSCLSLVCIATSSLLVDRILRYDLVTDRLRCQVGLWVALSLTTFNPSAQIENEESFQESRAGGNFLGWLHAVIFANIFALAVRATQYRYGGTAAPQSSIFGQHFVDLLPSSVWMGMVVSVPMVESYLQTWSSTEMEEDAEAFSWPMLVFACSLAVQSGLQWHERSNARMAQELQGIPSSHPPSSHQTSGSSLCSSTGLLHRASQLDESQWHTWKAADTLLWISIALEKALEDTEDQQFVLQLLAPQRITGDLLERLTADQLVRTLLVPYGPACRLAREIEDLLRRHPKPRGTTTSAFSSSFGPAMVATEGHHLESHEDWLTLHDREYNQPYRNTAQSNMGAGQPGTSFAKLPEQEKHNLLSAPSMTPEQEGHLANVMKERFGLELPTMKTSTEFEEQKASQLLSQSTPHEPTPPVGDLETPQHPPSPSFLNVRQHVATQSSPITNYADPSPPTPRGGSQVERKIAAERSHPTIPMGMLDQMPAHIREIAMRRPDLVRQLIDKKERTALQLNQGNQETPTLSVLRENEHEILEPNDDISDDETTSLVQRKKRPQYEALDGKKSS